MNASDIAIPKDMRAARLHSLGGQVQIDRIPVPEPRPMDVLVKVNACGIVPNMRRVMSNFFGTQMPDAKLLPPFPAIFGLDPVGVVARLGEHAAGIREGDRVYVNPARTCGGCRMCRTGRMLLCPQFSFQGYFVRSQGIAKAYPYGGFSQFITAPTGALVKLPDAVRDEEAARFGYFGTAYSAMKKIGVGPGEVVLINGISGTLGLCAAMLALAMGARKILGTGRNEALLKRVEALAPGRIFCHAMKDAADVVPGTPADPLFAWTRSMTDIGVDGMIDCLPPGAPASTMLRAIHTLRRGGRAVNVGAVAETLPFNTFWAMTNQIRLEGSVWFSTAEGEEIASMLATGALDMSAFHHRVAPLGQLGAVLEQMSAHSDGGFANYVIDPNAD
jgi:alcohol dehydrogenase